MAYWFTKSLFPPIARDVVMARVVTKNKDICCTQHLDLIYSQSGMFYNLILNPPRPSADGPHSKQGPHVDGVVGSTSYVIVG